MPGGLLLHHWLRGKNLAQLNLHYHNNFVSIGMTLEGRVGAHAPGSPASATCIRTCMIVQGLV